MTLLMDTKTRAQLKRIDPWEVRGAYSWVQQAKSLQTFEKVTEAQLMSLAPLASQVRSESDKSLGQSLRSRGVSEARVRRLLASDRTDITDQLIKVVRLLDREVNVIDLVSTAVFWGDHRRRDIARDYFGGDAADAV